MGNKQVQGEVEETREKMMKQVTSKAEKDGIQITGRESSLAKS